MYAHSDSSTNAAKEAQPRKGRHVCPHTHTHTHPPRGGCLKHTINAACHATVLQTPLPAPHDRNKAPSPKPKNSAQTPCTHKSTHGAGESNALDAASGAGVAPTPGATVAAASTGCSAVAGAAEGDGTVGAAAVGAAAAGEVVVTAPVGAGAGVGASVQTTSEMLKTE